MTQKQPIKANLIIIRGRNGSEIRGEDWDKLQHRAYMEMIPARSYGSDSVFDLVVLVPGMSPIHSDAVFYRGSNALAVSSDVVKFL